MKQTKALLTGGGIQPQVMRDLLRGLGIRREGRAIELLINHGGIALGINDIIYYLPSTHDARDTPLNRVSHIADVLQLEFPRAAEKLRAQLATLVLERL